MVDLLAGIIFCVGLGCTLIGVDFGGDSLRSRLGVTSLDRLETDGLKWIGMAILTLGLVMATLVVIYHPPLPTINVIETEPR